MSDEYTPQAWRMAGYYPSQYAKSMSALGIGIDYSDDDYDRYEAEFMADLAAHDERVKAEAKAEALEEAAREWAADPDAWGDNEKDFRNELRDRAAAIRAAAENGEKPARCLSCHEPAVDSGEGRFCGRCQDYEGTCINDHCLTCGATT